MCIQEVTYVAATIHIKFSVFLEKIKPHQNMEMHIINFMWTVVIVSILIRWYIRVSQKSKL